MAQSIADATDQVVQEPEVLQVINDINSRLSSMVGASNAVDATLGFSPSDPGRLLRALRLFIDGGVRDLSSASLGSANLLYLTLKALEFERLVAEGNRHHTFLGIEEPEAHLHPHLQRLVYRDFLRTAPDRPTTILLTTHSPHIVSVAPLKSIVLLRKTADGLSTEGSSTASIQLAAPLVADLERYLDVTRGEMLFAKGVILVEGDAERFLVPALAKAAGLDFDELGITVCAVAGVHFFPYITLLRSLGLPVAVITDGDPGVRTTGRARVETLFTEVRGANILAAIANAQRRRQTVEAEGFFAGDDTIETDLFRAGAHAAIGATLRELGPPGVARTRADGWTRNPASLDPTQLVADITEIGKGRFAQRLSTRLAAGQCPNYISNAIEYVRARCH